MDILIRLVTGKKNQVLCQIQNLNRLSHIQNKNFSTFGIGARLQHQRYRFRNCHKIPHDIRMGNRDRTSTLNLFFEQRNHTSVTAKHISKTHGYEICLRSAIIGLNDHLTDALAGTHDIGWINCLIRGNHHKFLHTVPICRLHNLPCAKHVILNCLVRTLFHERHMLMCRCMIDNLRLVMFKNPVHTIRIPHGCDQHNKIQIREPDFQFVLHIIGRILVNIHNNQLFWLVCGNLPAQFASDGATAPCNHYDFPRNIIHDGLQINRHRIPPKKIIDIYIF